MTGLIVALIGASLAACSNLPGRPARPAPLSLSCSDSAGQQGRDNERVIGGVEGLVLPESGDPAGLYPVGEPGSGKRYYVYKAFLAVAASAAPFATVTVIRPASARLVYGSPSRIADLFSADEGQPLVAAALRQVRLPVCGPGFTGFVGGIIVTGPACVTFEVSSPSGRAARVAVPIGSAACPS